MARAVRAVRLRRYELRIASWRHRKRRVDRIQRQHGAVQDDPRIERRIRIEPECQIVLQIVMNPETGADRPASRSCGIPYDAHARLQEHFRVVLG